MAKLYIDVTQLANWQGRLTGIPRVMDELSRRFESSDEVEEICFMRWSHPHGFVAVSLDNRVAPVVATEASAATGRQRSFAYRGIRKLYRHAPAEVRKAVGMVRRRNTTDRLSPEAEPLVEIPADSRIFVLWGEWSDSEYRQHLVDLHDERGVHLIQVAYDMLPLVTPQFSGHSTSWLNDYAREIYPRCDKLVAISENTKRDVVDWLGMQGLAIPEIDVIRLGDDFESAKAVRPAAIDSVDEVEFLLCVGTVEIRKNHQLLYYAYSLAKRQGIELLPVVIVGRRGWMTEQTYELMTKDPLVKDSFVFMHDASDEELSWLYEHCVGSIYPSFYEGWGLPVAESVMRGVPCLASNASSIPEVAGDLIDYFDPASPEECLKAIVALQKPDRNQELRSKLKAYRATTWDDTFEQVRKSIGV